MFMSVHKGEGGVKIVPNPVHVVCERTLIVIHFFTILDGRFWWQTTWFTGWQCKLGCSYWNEIISNCRSVLRNSETKTSNYDKKFLKISVTSDHIVLLKNYILLIALLLYDFYCHLKKLSLNTWIDWYKYSRWSLKNTLNMKKNLVRFSRIY